MARVAAGLVALVCSMAGGCEAVAVLTHGVDVDPVDAELPHIL